MENTEAAEAKMNAAREALLQYVERPGTRDRDEYRRLVARVKKAEAEFMRAQSSFDAGI
jgi:hypothetical protein